MSWGRQDSNLRPGWWPAKYPLIARPRISELPTGGLSPPAWMTHGVPSFSPAQLRGTAGFELRVSTVSSRVLGQLYYVPAASAPNGFRCPLLLLYVPDAAPGFSFELRTSSQGRSPGEEPGRLSIRRPLHSQCVRRPPKVSPLAGCSPDYDRTSTKNKG